MKNFIKLFFVDKKDLASYLDVDKRRWYETAIDVFQLKGFDKIIGVRFVGDLFSETMMWEDADHYLKFFEMEEVKTVTYKIKR
ncbi:MAG: hypothetical protein CMH22_05875 [Methylophaga sp.]|nr:hypothetical protein [Methylophaga sp.]|tara:strand:+ start:75768 stop:76016 length:249 start_codon:yes stop_codon:yes gene_type:complete